MLRVMTLNLWNLSGGWRDRRVEVVAWLELLQPDLVCVQEVIEDAQGRNTARWLADQAAYAHVFHHGTPTPLFEGITFGNAILSRWAIDHTNVVELPDDDPPAEAATRTLLHARTANGLDVYCTHLTSLPAHGYLRQRQVVALDAAVRDLSDPAAPLPPIVAGDFNADPDADEIRFLCGLATLDGRSTYYQEAWRVAGGQARGPGWTWENRNPFMSVQHDADRRIDYVFAGWRRDDGKGRIESCRVVCDRSLTGVYASDHYGVLAEIRD